MSQYSVKLENLLREFPGEKPEKLLVPLLESFKTSQAFIFPSYVADKCRAGREEVRKVLLFLWGKGVLDIFTVLEFDGRVLRGYSLPGIRTKEEIAIGLPEIRDEEDEPVPLSDIVPITAYKVINVE